MAMSFQLWRLVASKDDRTTTWELVDTFPNVKRARLHVNELAGRNIVSPDEDRYWYEDGEGVHTFRIEAVTQE
jgi:hypothetical protein